MKYKIVKGFLEPDGRNVARIEQKIQSNLEAGFELYGNLVYLGNDEYAQAMTYKGK